MLMKAPVQVNSLIEEIVQRIEDAVDNGNLLPGQQLVEEKLVALWQVSRPSLREAFRVLESSGYVERKPRKGVFISMITPTSVIELYEIRAALEGLAARLAVERCDPEVLARLKALDSSMRNLPNDDKSLHYSEYNQIFHQTLIEACGNAMLQKLLIPINKQAKRYRRVAHLDATLHTDSNLSHQEIIAFMEARDGLGAEQARRSRILKFAEYIAAKISAH